MGIVDIFIASQSTVYDSDGPNWDTLTVPVNITAGDSMVTAEVISEDDGTGRLPASLWWMVGALSIGRDPGEPAGCTPGYWKNHLDAWGPTGLDPGDDFDATFGTDFFDPDITLGEAINRKGGGTKKVARQGTAALLNVLHPAVDYPVSEAAVIAAVQAQDVDGLVAFNELSPDCPADC